MPSSGVQTCALRSEEHTSELQSHDNLVCRLLLEKKTPRAQPSICASPPPAATARAACGPAPRGLRSCAALRVAWVSWGVPFSVVFFFFLKARAPPALPPFPPPPPLRP